MGSSPIFGTTIGGNLWLAALPAGSVRVLPVAEQDRLATERQAKSSLRNPYGSLGATLAG
jgi:hypothetical protein